MFDWRLTIDSVLDCLAGVAERMEDMPECTRVDPEPKWSTFPFQYVGILGWVDYPGGVGAFRNGQVGDSPYRSGDAAMRGLAEGHGLHPCEPVVFCHHEHDVVCVGFEVPGLLTDHEDRILSGIAERLGDSPIIRRVSPEVREWETGTGLYDQAAVKRAVRRKGVSEADALPALLSIAEDAIDGVAPDPFEPGLPYKSPPRRYMPFARTYVQDDVVDVGFTCEYALS